MLDVLFTVLESFLSRAVVDSPNAPAGQGPPPAPGPAAGLPQLAIPQLHLPQQPPPSVAKQPAVAQQTGADSPQSVLAPTASIGNARRVIDLSHALIAERAYWKVNRDLG